MLDGIDSGTDVRPRKLQSIDVASQTHSRGHPAPVSPPPTTTPGVLSDDDDDEDPWSGRTMTAAGCSGGESGRVGCVSPTGSEVAGDGRRSDEVRMATTKTTATVTVDDGDAWLVLAGIVRGFQQLFPSDISLAP